MKRLAVVSLIWVLVLSGCTSVSAPPSWSDQPSEQYPHADYLTAVGEGPSREAAEQRALAALSRVFEVKIDEQSSDFSLFSSATGESSQAINRQLSSRQLLAATDQTLEGATPVEYWHHQQRHLVLVALERSGAEQRLRQQVVRLDQQTAALSNFAKQPMTPVLRISALEQARQLQRQRQPLNRNLSVVSGQQIPPLTTSAELEQRIRKELSELRLKIEPDVELRSLLEHAVAQLGGQVVNQGLQFNGVLDKEPITQKQGWYWQRGSLELTLAVENGEVIAQQRWPFKVSAQQQGMVEQRVKDQLNDQIAGQLYQLLSSAEVGLD